MITENPCLSDRIAGVVTWEDVEKMQSYQKNLTIVSDLMSSSNVVELEIRTLVSKLFKQRTSGTPYSNPFQTDDRLSLNDGTKAQSRYNNLKTACLMEIASILSGIEFKGETYPEMFYACTNRTGMTNILKCLNNIRQTCQKDGNFTIQQSRQLIMSYN